MRVIDETGKQLGILTLSEALKRAQDKQLDLIEIAPSAQPPVTKIIEFKKFLYLEEKKQKEARKHTKETELKEVRFSPYIGEHDLETGLKKVKRFLSEGNLVKISIVFKGRQMAHKEFGPKVLSRILEELEGSAAQDRQERFEGRRFTTLLRPVRKQVKQETETNKLETINKKPETVKSKTQEKQV